jgi:hypothetical protein
MSPREILAASLAVCAASLAIILGTPRIGFAQSSVVWSCDAMAAVPAGAPIPSGLYDALAGIVVFRPGQTGTMALICPILDDLDGVQLRSLRLTYRDGDGREGPSVVTAALRRVRRTDGHVATLANGGVSSNHVAAPNSGPSGWATHQSGSSGHVLNHVLDLHNYYYYVQINLSRSDASVPLAVMGVHLIN